MALAVGLDLTDGPRKGIESGATAVGQGKCFRSSAVIGSWSAWQGRGTTSSPPNKGFICSCRSTARSVSSPLSEMSVTCQQIDALLPWAPVATGDVLFTGTPQGVVSCIRRGCGKAHGSERRRTLENRGLLCVRVAHIARAGGWRREASPWLNGTEFHDANHPVDERFRRNPSEPLKSPRRSNSPRWRAQAQNLPKGRGNAWFGDGRQPGQHQQPKDRENDPGFHPQRGRERIRPQPRS